MEKWKSNMILPRYLFYLTNLFGFILCKDSFYPEYEHYYDGMDSRQKLGFKLFVRSYRKYNRTINHIPKDKLATMDEYLDVSGRGTMIENVLYDTLKEKYDREKASEKYPHPDDQEMYMAVRKYTPLLNSSEISNWIHNVNSRYRNIMNITEPSTLSTKKLPTTSGKSTKYRTRFTIFKPGQDPFGSLIGDDYYQEKTPSKQNYPKFKKRTIEPIYDNVERYYISSTKKVFNETHLDEGRENPAEAMVREYFKSHSITYKPNGGFQTCPTVSPAEQEKLIKQFEEMLKVPDMRLEEIFRNYENKSIYNSSYIDEYIRANNLSTIVVSDLSMLDNITLSTIENCIDERTTHTAQELKTKSPVSSLGQNEVEREDSFLWNITTVTTQRTTFETTSVNRLMTNENQIKKKIEEDKHLENSFQSFLNNNTLRELLNTLGESTMTKEISLSGETTPHPAFNSSLYRYIEDKFEEFQTACNGNLKDELGISDEKIKLDENDEEQRERYYNQKELFNKIIFQNTAELLGYKHIDRLYPSFEETRKIQESTKKTERSVNAITTLDPIENNVNKDNEVKETSIRKTEPTRVSTTEDSEDASIEVTECATFANKSLFYKQRYKKRHRKSHRSHKKRRHHHNYRNPNYMPPNPYHHYNPYYPPPPYPYPPQFYPQPPPPPPPQHPHFYHFTSSNWVDNQPDSMALRTTDDQFQLYLKLKDIFQPVDKALNGVASSTQRKTSTKLMKTTTIRSTQTRSRFTLPDLPTKGGTVGSEELQKFLEKHLGLPPPPPCNSSTDNPHRVRIENMLPKDIWNDSRYFYKNATRSLFDHHPNYPTSPRKHTNRHRHRSRRGRHHQCCCHHNHRNRRRRKPRGTRNYVRRKYHGGMVEETLIDSRDIPRERTENGITGYKSFDYTSFETKYRGLTFPPRNKNLPPTIPQC